MSKVRKNIKEQEDKYLYSSYYYDMATYYHSKDKKYDDFEKSVYLKIKQAAESGYYVLRLPLKVDFDLSFDWNWKHYKDTFNRLLSNLLLRGFKASKNGNYFNIYWDKK